MHVAPPNSQQETISWHPHKAGYTTAWGLGEHNRQVDPPHCVLSTNKFTRPRYPQSVSICPADAQTWQITLRFLSGDFFRESVVQSLSFDRSFHHWSVSKLYCTRDRRGLAGSLIRQDCPLASPSRCHCVESVCVRVALSSDGKVMAMYNYLAYQRLAHGSTAMMNGLILSRTIIVAWPGISCSRVGTRD